MRSRVEPGGWQANSVAVSAGVWSTIHIASGRRSRSSSTWYTWRRRASSKMISSPATRSVEVAEHRVLARAVAGDDDVADLARHRRPGPVAGAVVERGQPDPLVHRHVHSRSSGSRSGRPRYVSSVEPSSSGGAIGWRQRRWPTRGRRRRRRRGVVVLVVVVVVAGGGRRGRRRVVGGAAAARSTRRRLWRRRRRRVGGARRRRRTHGHGVERERRRRRARGRAAACADSLAKPSTGATIARITTLTCGGDGCGGSPALAMQAGIPIPW